MLKQIKMVLIAVALCSAIADVAEAADETPALVADAVVKELGDDIASGDKPAVRRFAILTVKSMKNVHPFSDDERAVVAHSAAVIVRRMKEDNSRLVGKRLEQSLLQFVNRHRANLDNVTNAMLARNWKSLRKRHIANAKRLRKELTDFFTGRPVVIVDMSLLARVEKLRQSGDRRPPESDEKARTNFFSILQQTTQRRLVDDAGYIDSVYFMATLTPRGSLSKSDLDRFHSFLDRRLAVDGVIVLGGTELYAAVDAAKTFLLTGKTPESPLEKRRFQQLRTNYRFLFVWRSARKLPPPQPLLVFGGKVPHNFLNGARFGFSRKKERRMSAEDIRRQVDLQQRIMIWCSSLGELVAHKDNLGSELLMKYLTGWAEKVLTLEEFLGTKNGKDVKFSRLEEDLLKLLRSARTELPLFTRAIDTEDAGEAGRARDDLANEWRGFLVIGNVPTEWKDIDRKAYLAIVPKLQRWEDAAYKRKITPKISRMNQLHKRANRLYLEVCAQLAAKHIGARGGKSGAIVYYAFEKKIVADGYLDYLFTKNEVPPKKLKQLNYIELALFRYLQVALKHNPMFRDLERVAPSAEIEKRFNAYLKAGRAPEEQAEYERAFRALEVAVGVVNAKPGEKFHGKTIPEAPNGREKRQTPAPDKNANADHATSGAYDASAGDFKADRATSSRSWAPIAVTLLLLAACAGLLIFYRKRVQSRAR